MLLAAALLLCSPFSEERGYMTHRLTVLPNPTRSLANKRWLYHETKWKPFHFGTSHQKTAPPALAQAAADLEEAKAAKEVCEVGVAYSNFDLGFHDGLDLEGCKERCTNIASCNFFSLAVEGAKRCHLMTNQKSTKADQRYVSGSRSCVAPSLQLPQTLALEAEQEPWQELGRLVSPHVPFQAKEELVRQFGQVQREGSIVHKCKKSVEQYGHPIGLWGGMDSDSDAEYPKLLMRRLAKDAHLSKYSRVFESGTGCGGMLWAVSQTVKGPLKEVAGNDIFDQSLEIARNYFQEPQSFHRTSSTNLSMVPSNHYDAAFSFGVLPLVGPVDQICAAMQEMVRITKRGGLVASFSHLSEDSAAPESCSCHQTGGGESCSCTKTGEANGGTYVRTPDNFWNNCFGSALRKDLKLHILSMEEAGLMDENSHKLSTLGTSQYITIKKLAPITSFQSYQSAPVVAKDTEAKLANLAVSLEKGMTVQDLLAEATEQEAEIE